MPKIIEIDLQFKTKIKNDPNDPPIKDADYVETEVDDQGVPIKYIFKNRNNHNVNPDELDVTIKGGGR